MSIESYGVAQEAFQGLEFSKGQLISKANCQVMNSSKKRTNEFVFTTMRSDRFLKKIEDTKNAF